MSGRYDAVVVGGGHNGLITAAYLGRAGLSTLLLERRDRVGGAAVTEEFHAGFRIDTAAHRVGRLEIGEASVAVAASSAHRDDAFLAARYVIDELKARAPIWKKEHWSGGAEWVEEGTGHGTHGE